MTILVTGATGNVGRNVVSQLVRRGAKVRTITRDPGAARFSKDVEVLEADLTRPDTIRRALDGVEGMYLFPIAYKTRQLESFDDYVVTADIPGLARDAGVQRIVLLSSNAVLHDGDPHHQEAEEAVEASGVDFTLLRPGEFCMNKLFGWGHSIRTADVVRSGFPNAVGVPIHEADVAAVAVAALLKDGHLSARYEMTGPQALTEREQVGEIAAGLGRDIAFEELTPEQARQEWIDQGLPAGVVDEMLEHSGKFASKPPAVVETVEQVTGRPGRTLRQWAADHRADFR